MKSALLVSACLLGERCRYDGGAKPLDSGLIERLRETYTLVPVCPETLGGLPVPREPSERRGNRVVSRTGQDVTARYRLGAARVLETARKYGCTAALLKERSPACGSGSIYDGSFTGRLIPGDGVAASLLRQNGIAVYGEGTVEILL